MLATWISKRFNRAIASSSMIRFNAARVISFCPAVNGLYFLAIRALVSAENVGPNLERLKIQIRILGRHGSTNSHVIPNCQTPPFSRLLPGSGTQQPRVITPVTATCEWAARLILTMHC